MTSDVQICQSALVRIGASPLTSFVDGSAEAIVAANAYPQISRAALTEYRWRWATTTRLLDELADEPDEPWTAGYQLPGDCLALHTVVQSGLPVAYDLMGSVVLVATAMDSYATFTWAVPESQWPPLFIEYVILKMATVFATGVAQKAEMGSAMMQMALVAGRQAKAMDAQSRTGQQLRVGTLRARRF